MATKLAVQLAQIRARSTNPLDLKAQKKAHSQSLLFDPHLASTQDFDTIYHICFEGFKDLCNLDGRFAAFSRNLFSEQSKHEDRTQMTAAQNEQLDAVVESFLELVGAKLLLKPGLKAIEWLIRRFRCVQCTSIVSGGHLLMCYTYSVHEHNTLCLIMTILPYHAASVFPTVLSILPHTLPPTLKFLHPYIQSLTSPPRHTIVYTASSNIPFLTALSSYVLKSCHSDHQYPALLSFWASITTEAITAMCTQSRSARLEAQKQHQEDLIRFILPILNDALSLSSICELRIASYMILAVLAIKADLDDGVLTAIMEAVVVDWASVSHAGLICLAVLAEQMRDIKLSKRVFRALLSLQGLDEDLITLQNQYNVDKLTLGIIFGIAGRLKKSRDGNELRLLRSLLEARLMNSASTTAACRYVLLTIQGMKPSSDALFDVQASAADLVIHLAGSPIVGAQMQAIIRELRVDVGQLEMSLQSVNYNEDAIMEALPADAETIDVDRNDHVEDFEESVSKIPTRTAYETSFLSHSNSYVFGSLEKAFQELSESAVNLQKFSDLPVLRKSLATEQPLFLSFFVRVWCGIGPPKVRAAAVHAVRQYIHQETNAVDVQFLLPYVLYGLGDAAAPVRKAIGDLILNLTSLYTRTETKDTTLSAIGYDQIYGSGEESRKVSWLSLQNARRFVTKVLAPSIEECLLDPHHVSSLVVDSLSGTKDGREARSTHNELKTSSRLAIFTCLSSHAVNTPLFAVKLRLLQMLNQLDKVGGTSRTKLLLPILSALSEMSETQVASICGREQIDMTTLISAAVSVIVPSDRDGLRVLKSIIEDPRSGCPVLQEAALHHLRIVWPSMKTDLQSMFAEVLFELGVSNTTDQPAHRKKAEVLETLAALRLPQAILKSLLEDLPALSSDDRNKQSASKRRRLGRGQVKKTDGSTLDDFGASIRRVSLVLQLVEGSQVDRHPDLLQSLFQVFADLQHSPRQFESGVAYLQVQALDAMLAIINKSQSSAGPKIEPLGVRVDVLIDCIRITTSPQVRNAAFLLLSAFANIVPDLILHSVMPVFTFLGSSVLRQEDEYSSHVIKHTMDSIIPRLVQSLHKRKGSLSAVSELLLSFAAAFEHVPFQRRLDLYTSLVNKVGPDAHLFAFLAILLDKYPKNRRVIQFAVDLTNQYDVKTQLKAMNDYLGLMIDSSKPKPTISIDVLSSVEKQSGLDVSLNLLPLVPALLNNGSLVAKTRKALLREDSTNTVRSLYEGALEQIFLLSESTYCNKRMHILCMQALDAILSLLPLSELVNAFEKLLDRTYDNTRLQVLRSLEHRLGDKVDLQSAQQSCLQLLPRLVSIVSDTSDMSLRHTAINTIDRIVEKFGRKDLDAVVDCARTIASPQIMKAAEPHIRVTSILCLVTFVEIARDALIPLIPFAIPTAIENLEESTTRFTENAALHDAVYSFVVSLLLYIPWMIKGENLDRLMIASHKSASAGLGEKSEEARREALSLIAQHLDARVCIASIDRTWTSAMTQGSIAIKEHLEILRLMIDPQVKSVIVKHSQVLGDFFLKAFDLRRAHSSSQLGCSYTEDEIAKIEGAINDSAIAMVYKLNDATFRPYFTRALDWATTLPDRKDSKGKTLRRTTLYTFLLKFFDTLKVSWTSNLSILMLTS